MPRDHDETATPTITWRDVDGNSHSRIHLAASPGGAHLDGCASRLRWRIRPWCPAGSPARGFGAGASGGLGERSGCGPVRAFRRSARSWRCLPPGVLDGDVDRAAGTGFPPPGSAARAGAARTPRTAASGSHAGQRGLGIRRPAKPGQPLDASRLQETLDERYPRGPAALDLDAATNHAELAGLRRALESRSRQNRPQW